MAKKRVKGDRTTSAERARALLQDSRIQEPLKEGGPVIMQRGVEQKIEPIVTREDTTIETIKDLHLKGIRVQKESLELDSRVWRLFEETRDGKETSESYRQELINNSTISGGQVFDAVSLGIKSWGSTFFGKER